MTSGGITFEPIEVLKITVRADYRHHRQRRGERKSAKEMKTTGQWVVRENTEIQRSTEKLRNSGCVRFQAEFLSLRRFNGATATIPNPMP